MLKVIIVNNYSVTILCMFEFNSVLQLLIFAQSCMHYPCMVCISLKKQISTYKAMRLQTRYLDLSHVKCIDIRLFPSKTLMEML